MTSSYQTLALINDQISRLKEIRTQLISYGHYSLCLEIDGQIRKLENEKAGVTL